MRQNKTKKKPKIFTCFYDTLLSLILFECDCFQGFHKLFGFCESTFQDFSARAIRGTFDLLIHQFCLLDIKLPDSLYKCSQNTAKIIQHVIFIASHAPPRCLNYHSLLQCLQRNQIISKQGEPAPLPQQTSPSENCVVERHEFKYFMKHQLFKTKSFRRDIIQKK